MAMSVDGLVWKWGKSHKVLVCAGQFYANLTQARVIWEEGLSIEKMLP